MTLLARYSPRFVSLAIHCDSKHRRDNTHCAESEDRPEDTLMALSGCQAQINGDNAAFREVESYEVEDVGGEDGLYEAISCFFYPDVGHYDEYILYATNCVLRE